MIIHTVMGNRSHPEYGVASIPFPISTDEWKNAMTSSVYSPSINNTCYHGACQGPIYVFS